MERFANVASGIMGGLIITLAMAMLSVPLKIYWLDAIGFQLMVAIMGVVAGFVGWLGIKYPQTAWHQMGFLTPLACLAVIWLRTLSSFPAAAGDEMFKGLFLLVTGLTAMSTYMVTIKSL